jgi:CheY-like chemotaxis protein
VGAPASIPVLIADDEAAIAELVATVVREAGDAPRVAPNGCAALALARRDPPALVITDLMMPLLDGAGLIAALRAEAAAAGRAAPPVILLTAAGPEPARAAGADAVLAKPFDLAALEGLLGRFLGAP